jgi:hypothetical protein
LKKAIIILVLLGGGPTLQNWKKRTMFTKVLFLIMYKTNMFCTYHAVLNQIFYQCHFSCIKYWIHLRFKYNLPVLEKELNPLPAIKIHTHLMPPDHRNMFFKSKPGSLVCSFCARKFSFTNHLIRHVQLAHPNNVTSKILRSVARGKMSSRPNQHQECTSKIVYCQDCDAAFINKGSLRLHVLAAHTNQSPSCKRKVGRPCSKVLKFTNQRNKKYPDVTHHKCVHENCSKAFASKGKLDNHIKLEHLSCPIIGKSSIANPTFLSEDLATHRPQNSDVIMPDQEKSAKLCCGVCMKQLGSCKSLRHHIKILHPELGNESCPFHRCTIFCSSRDELRLHYKNVHHLDGPLFCDQCDFRAQVAGRLRLHMAHHSHLKVQVKVKLQAGQSTLVSNVSRCPHCRWMKMVKYFASHCQESACPDCRSVFPCKGLKDQHNCPIKVNQQAEVIHFKLSIDF